MELKRIPRDLSRWVRRKTGTFGSMSGRLDKNRPDQPPPLLTEHIASTKVFASRNDFLHSLPKGSIGAEVGVQRGNFSVHILDVVAPKELHLIDISFAKLGDRFADNPAAVRHEGRSVDMLEGFPDGYFDWIYIDADHSYKGVRADASVAARKVKPDGLLVFNDYIIWAHHEGLAYGVVQAVNEMCVNEGWEMAAFCLHPNMHCDVAIRRRRQG